MAERHIVYMPLAEILPALVNPKPHDLDAIDRSMDRLGYGEPPLLDDRTGRMVAGHGRIEALEARRDRGEAPPDGIIVLKDGTWTAPVTRGWASVDDDHAAAYLVASNQLTIANGYDDRGLVDMLTPLPELMIEAAGFTTEMFDELVAATTMPEFQPEPDDSQPRLDQLRPVVCPECQHEFHPR